MKAILEYGLNIGSNTIQLHKNSQLLHVNFQRVDDKEDTFGCALYVLADEKEELEERSIVVVATEELICSESDNDLEYINSCRMGDDVIMFHAFELK